MSAPGPAANVMTPVVAFTAKLPLTLPLRIEKVSGKPCGSVALTAPMTKPVAALSGTLKEDAKTSGGLFTEMTVGVAEEEPLADFEDMPDELAVADVEAETVAELVAAPVATLEALAEAETLEVVVAVLVALLVAEPEPIPEAEACGVIEKTLDIVDVAVADADAVLEAVADDVAVDELVGEPEADEVELAVPELELELVDALVAAGDAERKALGEADKVGEGDEVAVINAVIDAVLLGKAEVLGNDEGEADLAGVAVGDAVGDSHEAVLSHVQVARSPAEFMTAAEAATLKAAPETGDEANSSL